MFAMCNVPSCQAVIRNLVYRAFTIGPSLRVYRSANKLLLCAIGSSDITEISRTKYEVVTACAFSCVNTIAMFSPSSILLCIVRPNPSEKGQA